ncbi:MAG: O-antigen ligase family protein [bacterium]|nr:O-antigen ligase family protein [bacterium]
MQFLRKPLTTDHIIHGIFALIAFAVLWKGGKSLESTWIFAGAVFALTIFLHKTLKRTDAKDSVHLALWAPVIFLICWTFISFAFSSTQNYGFDELLRTGACGLLFLWVVRLTASQNKRLYDKTLLQLIRTIAIVTLTACGIGFAVYTLQPVNRFVGTFFDARFHTDYWPNAWSNFVLLTWPFVYYWAFRGWSFVKLDRQTVIDTAVRCVAVGIVLGSFFLSYSRGATIALCGQLVLLGALYGFIFKKSFPWKKVLAVTAGIFLVALTYFSAANALRQRVHDVISVNEKVTFSADEGVSSVSERQEFWVQAIALANQKPLFGWGPYSFRFVQPRFQTTVLATSDHPHNVFLKAAAERGWPVAIALLVLFGSVMLSGLQGEFKKEFIRPHHASFGVLLSVALAGSLAHNLIDYNMQFVSIAMLFWLLLGVLASRIEWAKAKRAPAYIARHTEMVIAIIFLTFAILEGGYLVLSSVGRHAQAAGDSEAAMIWFNRASGELFARDLQLSRAEILTDMGKYGRANDAIAEYFKRNGEDARAWKRRAALRNLQSETQGAIEDYEHALSLGGFNDIGIMGGIIAIELDRGGRKSVDDRREEVDVLLRGFADAITKNTHFIALSPNVEDFIDLADTFARIYRREAPLYEVLAARVDHNAKLERNKIRSRAPGFLW